MTRIEWSKQIDRYISEGRTVSGGCGPSQQVQGLTNDVKAVAANMRNDATAIWGEANNVVNKLSGVFDKILAAGPGQFGFSQGEENAMRAQAANQAADVARNMRGAATASAAYGGGNTVMSSGATQAAELAEAQAGATYGANAQNQITQAGYAQGNKNFTEAAQVEQQLPGILESTTNSQTAAANQTQQALKDQQQMDTMSNWWQPLVENAAVGAIGAATGDIGSRGIMGALGNLGSGSSFGETLSNLGQGFLGNTTPAPNPTPTPVSSPNPSVDSFEF